MAVDPAPGTITIAQAARLLGLSPIRVKQLCQQGWIERVDRGRVTIVGAVQGYIKSIHSARERREDRAEATAPIRDARARQIELKVATERENLIERADAEAAMNYVVEVTKAELATLPKRIGGITAGRRSAKELVEAVGRTIDRSLDQQIDNLRTGDF